MNRNLLPIAIAAIAVVGITAGVLLAGVGQSGPLAGSATKRYSVVTLGASIVDETG